jgi:hypothetical protein
LNATYKFIIRVENYHLSFSSHIDINIFHLKTIRKPQIVPYEPNKSLDRDPCGDEIRSLTGICAIGKMRRQDYRLSSADQISRGAKRDYLAARDTRYRLGVVWVAE